MLKAAQIFLVYFMLGSSKTILTLPMIENQADPIIGDDVAFVKLGTYSKLFFLNKHVKF